MMLRYLPQIIALWLLRWAVEDCPLCHCPQVDIGHDIPACTFTAICVGCLRRVSPQTIKSHDGKYRCTDCKAKGR